MCIHINAELASAFLTTSLHHHVHLDQELPGDDVFINHLVLDYATSLHLKENSAIRSRSLLRFNLRSAKMEA